MTNDAAGLVSYSKTGTTWTNVSSTSFNFVEIGYMHQALISLTDIAVGAPVQYRVGGPVSGFSPTFTAVPRPARGDSEVFAVFGDFGLTNDVCMDALVGASPTAWASACPVGERAPLTRPHPTRRRFPRPPPRAADSKAGVFDSVLHVGDWAYNFEVRGGSSCAAARAPPARRPRVPAARIV